jgi:hypothetical protein
MGGGMEVEGPVGTGLGPSHAAAAGSLTAKGTPLQGIFRREIERYKQPSWRLTNGVRMRRNRARAALGLLPRDRGRLSSEPQCACGSPWPSLAASSIFPDRESRISAPQRASAPTACQTVFAI